MSNFGEMLGPNPIYGPYNRELITDVIRFSDGRLDPFELADTLLRRWIEDTIEDTDIWSHLSGDRTDEVAEKYAPHVYARWQEEAATRESVRRGERQPLVWKEVTIKAGSKVRMAYGNKHHYADVKAGRIIYEGEEYSPSQWARKIADDTSRNAWRDLWFREPLSDTWVPAELLRDQARAKLPGAPDFHDAETTSDNNAS